MLEQKTIAYRTLFIDFFVILSDDDTTSIEKEWRFALTDIQT